MQNNTNITLWVLITTMNDWIYRVKKELLPQLINVDEVIISHQITDWSILPESNTLWDNVKYFCMFEKWLSKNRNNAISKSTTDICYICDDDLNFIDWFENIIKDKYLQNNYDVITFQAENGNWKKHFKLLEWKHNMLSVLKIWSWGITFRRNSLSKIWMKFDENFWLWTKFPVWEENIFLTDCIKSKLNVYHFDNSIVIHPDESSWMNYRDELIIARIKVFKRLFWFFWWILWVIYFTIFDYNIYKNKYSIKNFFILSFKSLINEK